MSLAAKAFYIILGIIPAWQHKGGRGGDLPAALRLPLSTIVVSDASSERQHKGEGGFSQRC